MLPLKGEHLSVKKKRRRFSVGNDKKGQHLSTKKKRRNLVSRKKKTSTLQIKVKTKKATFKHLLFKYKNIFNLSKNDKRSEK